MKNRKVHFYWGFILLFSALWLVPGCASTESSHGAYPTLKQTEMNGHWPMVRYGNAAARGGLTLGERERVDDAYNNFKKAFAVAVQEAHGNLEATTPDNVKDLANEVIRTISAIPE